MAQYIPNPNLSALNSTAPVLKEKVELFITCNDIIKKDFQSDSDPFVVVYLKPSKQKQFEEIGRTEVIHDNHYPTFSTQFRLDYYFEQEQILRFDVFDEDKKGSNKLKDHDIIGNCTMKLGEIIHEPGCIMAKKVMHKGKYLKNKKTKNFTHLIVTAEKVNEGGNEEITLQFSCKGLPKMDGLFGKTDPYFIMERLREDNKKIKVYGNRNSFIKRNLNPTFDAFKIQTQRLCNNDEYRPIIISIYDWDDDGRDDYIGCVQTSLNELKTKPKGLKIRKQNKSKKHKVYGTLNVLQYASRPLASFLDYMQGTLDMSLMVAIDFTGSNGDPRDVQSLHHFTSTTPSSYQQAIRQIGAVLSEYDTDQKYPVWGFGAHFNNVLIGGKEYWNGVKHLFNLNFNISDPEVRGVIGIEEAYTSAIKQQIFALSGPTLFGPILEKAKNIAHIAHGMTMKDVENNKIQYYILLIITDGVITDMKQTKNEIVDIANGFVPLSVIIVGVGSAADWTDMDELDGDENGLINSNGQHAKRDVLQFVPMDKYKNNVHGLSQETLCEIPHQFLSYVRYHNIKPGKRIPPQMKVIDNQFKMSEEEQKEEEEEQQDGSNDVDKQLDNSYWDNVPLPVGWERGYDENGNTYYVNNAHQTTQWLHPSTQKL